MKKTALLLFAALSATAVSAQQPSTFERLSPALKAPADQLRVNYENLDDIRAVQKEILATLDKVAQPSDSVTAPASGIQPAVTLYVYRPKNSRKDETLPAIYYTHGGGYLAGHARQSGDILQRIADKHHLAVVSVKYRLAVEKPFPADLNDAYHGLRHMQTHSKQFGIDPNRVLLMGNSAGGGLAARLALYTRDKAEITQPVGQLLIYPMLDYRTGTAESPYPQDHTGEFVWTRTSNRLGWTTLRGGQNIPTEQMPYYSAATATNLKGLPKTFIYVGDLDLFVHEDIDYANRLIGAGVETRLNVVPNVYHAVEYNAPEAQEARDYFQMLDTAIAEMLGK